MNPPANDARMAAGIASIAAHERAQREAERLDAERAAAVPAPPSIANRPGRAERVAAERVRCPYCHASPGQPCHGARQRILSAAHPSRVDAYAVQTVTCPECQVGAGARCRCADDPYFSSVHAGRVEAAFVVARALGRQA